MIDQSEKKFKVSIFETWKDGSLEQQLNIV